MAQTFDYDIGNVVGPPGATGNGIKSIQLLSTSGLVKTYRITMTDDTIFDFNVSDGEDGNGISGASFDSQTNELTITFDDGTSFTTPSLKGVQGDPGDDGYSPAVTIETITGGHRVTITDEAHPSGQSFDVMDGEDGGGDVTDVQINGTSIIDAQGVANIPVGSQTRFGVAKGFGIRGIGIDENGNVLLQSPTNAEIKGGSTSYRSISPSNQHSAAFYGLAKAAGDTTQSASSNAVGAYTDEAKAAINTMLGSIQAPANPSSGAFLVWNGTAWVAQTLTTWQGGSY